MAFSGFSAAGVDLLQLNRLQNSKEFYEEHKAEIRRLAIEPFHALIEQMTPTMLAIDPLFVTTPSRMVSRVRRDTRYTHDKSLYRANLWLFFRRPRAQHEAMPAYYFELHPEYWAYGCWGAWGRGEMEQAREMILREDALFHAAYDALASCKHVQLAGEMYKRLRYADAPEAFRMWLNRKELGADYRQSEDFAPVLDGSFVQPMLEEMQRLAPFYRFLMAAKERAAAASREAVQ